MGYEKSAKYYDLFGEKPDIQYYKELGIKYSAALEIGVGTARVAVELAKAGVAVWGIDNSEEMLAVARKKVLQQPADVQKRITLVHADMTDFNLSKTFSFIYVPSSGLNHCITTEDQLNCLTCVYDHLEDCGLFVFDLELPSPDYKKALTLIEKEQVGDRMILRWISNDPDYTEQVLHTTLIFEEYHQQKLQERIVEMSTVSLIYKRELLLLLEKANFKVQKMYGDFQKSEQVTDLLVVEAGKLKRP